MSERDGGPAFPVEAMDEMRERILMPGMSLRDYFATQAMVGLMTASLTQNVAAAKAGVCAELAYQHADAMLKERAKWRDVM